MDQVAARSEPLLSMEMLREDERQMGRLLYQVLASNLKGKALGFVMACPKGHGLEVWRRMTNHYEPHVGARFAAVLNRVLNPHFKGDFLSEV